MYLISKIKQYLTNRQNIANERAYKDGWEWAKVSVVAGVEITEAMIVDDMNCSFDRGARDFLRQYTPPETATQYTSHECPSCIFLGQHGSFDLYYCTQHGNPTVIARYGDTGPDYTSGLCFVGAVPALTEAYRRAVERGLINPTKDRL